MSEISTTRWKEMERLAAQNPNIEFPIIITLKEGASEESLRKSGFSIQYGGSRIVSGSAPLKVLKKLNELNEVDLIEEDGEVRAI